MIREPYTDFETIVHPERDRIEATMAAEYDRGFMDGADSDRDIAELRGRVSLFEWLDQVHTDDLKDALDYLRSRL